MATNLVLVLVLSTGMKMILNSDNGPSISHWIFGET